MRNTFLGDTLFTLPDRYDGSVAWVGWSILWLCTLLILGGIIFGTLYLIDSVGLDDKSANGNVVGHSYQPAYTSITYTHVNNMTIPNTVYHPEQWMICIEINGLYDWVSVDQTYYHQIYDGTVLKCTYSNGRIWDSMYVKTFQLKTAVIF